MLIYLYDGFPLLSAFLSYRYLYIREKKCLLEQNEKHFQEALEFHVITIVQIFSRRKNEMKL